MTLELYTGYLRLCDCKPKRISGPPSGLAGRVADKCFSCKGDLDHLHCQFVNLGHLKGELLNILEHDDILLRSKIAELYTQLQKITDTRDSERK